MVEIVIDSNNLQTIVVALIPIIAYLITYVKGKLSNAQGDMAFSQMKNWAKQLESLAVVIPDLKGTSEELTNIVAHAEILWTDPENNSAELAQIFAHSTILFNKAMEIIAKLTAHKV